MGLRSYASLAALRLRNKVTDGDTDDDPRLLSKLREATEAIEQQLNGRIFQPVIATRKFNYLDETKLDLRANDLLSITSITNGDGSAIDPAAVVAFDQGYIELDPAQAFFTYVNTETNAISVTGVWGFHRDYDLAWHSSGVTLSASINDSVTSNIATTDSDGEDVWGKSPALSPAMLIRIDNEFMHLIAVSTNAIKVVRAANGSTKAAHNSDATIEVYEASDDIVGITLRWAALLAAQDDTDFGKKTITAYGIEIPVGLPADMVQRLVTYKKVRV